MGRKVEYETPEEFQAVTVELIDKVDRQGQDLGAKNVEIERLHKAIAGLNDQLQVSRSNEQNADEALKIACRKAEEAQGNFLLADRARAEAQKTITVLEQRIANLNAAAATR